MLQSAFLHGFYASSLCSVRNTAKWIHQRNLKILIGFEEFRYNWSSEVSSWRSSACLCIWSARAEEGRARPKEQGRGGGGGWWWLHLPGIQCLFLSALRGWPKGSLCLSLHHWVHEGEGGALCLPWASFLWCTEAQLICSTTSTSVGSDSLYFEVKLQRSCFPEF